MFPFRFTIDAPRQLWFYAIRRSEMFRQEFLWDHSQASFTLFPRIVPSPFRKCCSHCCLPRAPRFRVVTEDCRKLLFQFIAVVCQLLFIFSTIPRRFLCFSVLKHWSPSLFRILLHFFLAEISFQRSFYSHLELSYIFWATVPFDSA